MKRHPKPWAKALTGALVLLLTVVFATPPALAAEVQVTAPAQQTPTTTPELPKTEKTTLAAAAAAKVEALDTAEAVEAAPAVMQDAEAPSQDAGSFFKSPKGIAALVLIVAGTGYAFMKRSDDRIISPVR